MALLLALVVSRLTARFEWPRQRVLLAGAVAAGLLLVAEATRFLERPELLLDGRPIAASDVPSPEDHLEHTVAFR